MSLEAGGPNAPIILTATMGGADAAWATALRTAHFPPERNYLRAHITLFYHLPGPEWPLVKDAVKRLTADNPPPRARIDRLLNLGRGVAFHVESPDLLAMREDLAMRSSACSPRRTAPSPVCTSPCRTKWSQRQRGRCCNRWNPILHPAHCRLSALTRIIIAAARGRRFRRGNSEAKPHFAAAASLHSRRTESHLRRTDSVNAQLTLCKSPRLGHYSLY